MDAQRLIALLRRPAKDPEVEAAFVELRTRRRPELDPKDRDSLLDWVMVRRQGIELGFADEVYFKGGEKWRRRRKGVPLLLHQIYFYTQRDDIATFPGQLPYGLEWSNNREQVRKKLIALEARRRSHLKDVWQTPECLLTADYREEGAALDSVLCHLPLEPLPEEGRRQPNVMPGDWVASFGQPLASPVLRQQLRPLVFTPEGDENQADFSQECGLQLFFTAAKELKLARQPVPVKKSDLVFAAVRFLRARELDGRQWGGTLPFGLLFDDSQEALIRKVGRKPDSQEDEKLSGWALWRLPEAQLHVLYSNMHNYVLRVTLMAPGY